MANKNKFAPNSLDKKNIIQCQRDNAEFDFKKLAVESGWSEKAIVEISKWYNEKR